MHIAALHADFGVVLRQVFRHSLCESGDQDALSSRDALSNFMKEIVNLAGRLVPLVE
jgi:hypothetical protein